MIKSLNIQLDKPSILGTLLNIQQL